MSCLCKRCLHNWSRNVLALYKLAQSLPVEFAASLPSIEQIEQELANNGNDTVR